GIFLQQVAEGGYREVVIKKSLRGIIIGNIMTRGVITIEGDFSLQRIVDEYFFKYHFNSFPVISSSKLVGVLSLNDVRAISRDAWGTTKVRDVMKPIDQQAILSQESTALDALTKMVELGVGRLPVLGKGRLVGIISRRDLMKLMAFKTDLGI
ncbi:MAG: CBS domain-containing protein, partial [Thermodesulfobacteriota bacterium]